jgi:hypothetical protein
MFRSLFLIPFGIYALAQMTSFAEANGCPVVGGETKLSLIESAPTCQEAARLFRLCAVGASLDGRLALLVEKVCERSSLAQLPGKEREAYQAAIDACNAPYARKRGTIYRSVAAHCRVDAMASFASGHY